MPRQARLDAPGLLHHVIARGIERRAIFLDNGDYADFISRLETSLRKSPNQILAWALMPNHFHLLIRSGTGGVPSLMRRLMTGYAVTFNRRHKRAGHLFQNRYKSIICEEEPYFLELVRYIHLNPLRAGLVPSLEALRKFPHTGHSALMGALPRKWQETESVLVNFGTELNAARNGYERFIWESRHEKSRPDLLGGGLVRSLGGLNQAIRSRLQGAKERFDERILGSGGFVEEVLKVAEKKESLQHELAHQHLTAQEMGSRIAAHLGLEAKRLFMKGRQEAVSRAKALLIHAGVEYLGRTTKEMAGLTKMTGPCASRARLRGEILWHENGIEKALKQERPQMGYR